MINNGSVSSLLLQAGAGFVVYILNAIIQCCPIIMYLFLMLTADTPYIVIHMLLINDT